MKILGAGAAAIAILAQTAYADIPTQASFRSPAPAAFSASDIATYGVDADTAMKMEQYRRDGYQVVALKADQLAADKAGLSSTTWIIIGVVVLVVIVAAASGGGGGGGGY